MHRSLSTEVGPGADRRSREEDEEEEEPEGDPQPSTSSGRKSLKRKDVDEAVVNYLQSAAKQQSLIPQLQASLDKVSDRRQAYAQYFCSEASKISEEYWQMFVKDSIDLLFRYQNMPPGLAIPQGNM